MVRKPGIPLRTEYALLVPSKGGASATTTDNERLSDPWVRQKRRCGRLIREVGFHSTPVRRAGQGNLDVTGVSRDQSSSLGSRVNVTAELSERRVARPLKSQRTADLV